VLVPEWVSEAYSQAQKQPHLLCFAIGSHHRHKN